MVTLSGAGHPQSVEYDAEKQRALIFADLVSGAISGDDNMARENFISDRVMNRLVEIARTGNDPGQWQSFDDLILA